jgi:hypothetical protein
LLLGLDIATVRDLNNFAQGGRLLHGDVRKLLAHLILKLDDSMVALLDMVVLLFDLIGLRDKRVLGQFAIALKLDYFIHVLGQSLGLAVRSLPLWLLAKLNVAVKFFYHFLKLLFASLVALLVLSQSMLTGLKLRVQLRNLRFEFSNKLLKRCLQLLAMTLFD